MSFKNTEYRYLIFVITAYLLCLTLELAQSMPTPEAQTKTVRSDKKIPVGEIKRLTDFNRGTKKVTSDRAVNLSNSNKFQARMMQADKQQQNSYFSSPDSWHPHSLMPTFTDQEQGDEMVALASEAEPESLKVSSGNRLNSSSELSHKYDKRVSEFKLGRSPIPPERSNRENQGSQKQANGKQHQQTEDYYSDDEEDEEDPSKLLRGELELIGASQAERKEENFNLKSIQHADDQNNDYSSPTTFDDTSYRRQMEQTANRSSMKLSTPVTENGWLTSDTSSNSRSYALNPANGQQRQQQQQQPLIDLQLQRQQPSVKLQDVQQKHQHDQQQPTGEKLAGLFGGIGSISKADVAIEYLKNILKNKQSLLNNSTSDTWSADFKQPTDSSNGDKGTSLHRLSSFASRLNQMLNNTSPQFSVSNNSYEIVKVDKSAHESKKTLIPVAPTEPIGEKGQYFLPQQADTKFSIVDVKPTPNLDLMYQSQTFISSTTKLPDGEGSNRQSSQLSDYSKSQSQASQQTREINAYPQELLTGGSVLNGTPLGGDYIESLDDFPRALRQQQHLLSSEKQQVPLRQQDSKQDQSLTQTGQISETSALIRDHNNHHLRNQPHPNQLDPMQFQQSAYEAFQDQQPGGPSYSRYFQMQQPTFDYIPHTSSKYLISNDSSKNLNIDKNFIIQAPNSNPSYSIQQQKIVDHSHSQHQIAGNKTLEQQNVATKRDKTEEVKRQPQARGQPRQQVQTFFDQHQYHHQQQLQQHQQQSAQQATISSKLYKNEQTISSQPIAHQPTQQIKSIETSPKLAPRTKPPKIVSYNYFESPTEAGESELMATNYQLGDALYSSAGGVEQILSNTELEAIQNQFMTAEHPIVPVSSEQVDAQQTHQLSYQDSNFAGLLASSIKPNNFQPEVLQRLTSPVKQAEDALRELASNEDQVTIAAPSIMFNQARVAAIAQQHGQERQKSSQTEQSRKHLGRELDVDETKKRKSLVVYLNHPRPNEMSKVSSLSEDYNLAQSIADQSVDSFISAKEFDSHGLSKESKHLDISNLNGLKEIKEGQDKDGLSVVVIGDAYKYKKIVLLMSSKSGGLKFIPMVKEMKK